MDVINPFLRHAPGSDQGSPPAPHRVYAFVDQIEPVSEAKSDIEAAPLLPSGSGPVVLLDCIDANWFDKYDKPGGPVSEQSSYFEGARLYLVHMRLQDLCDKWPAGHEQGDQLKLLQRLLSAAREGVSSDGPPLWLELELSSGGGEGLLYRNLFGDPSPVTINSLKHVAPATLSKLDGELSLNDVPDASHADIEDCLKSAGVIDHVVVYDVGQGSSAGLCSATGSVAVYADIGGGVAGHAKTFPTSLNSFCFCANPSIVLSHWDHDHWSSANRHTAAFRCKWIVPRQPLGGIHRTLAFNIQFYGTLLVWPSRTQSIAAGQIRIELCTGPQSSRNQSGLAVILSPPEDVGDPMLFPGDASYNNVPSVHSRPRTLFAAAVVPHHGGDMGAPRIAAGYPGPLGRVVYSYGPNNSYGHGRPNSPTRQDHVKNRWSDQHVSTCVNPPYEVRQTEDRMPPLQLGHVYLCWRSKKTISPLPCNGACQLKALQT